MHRMKGNLEACTLLYFLLSFSSVHVHNDFLLAILTRCQIIVSTPGIMCLKQNNKKSYLLLFYESL